MLNLISKVCIPENIYCEQDFEYPVIFDNDLKGNTIFTVSLNSHRKNIWSIDNVIRNGVLEVLSEKLKYFVLTPVIDFSLNALTGFKLSYSDYKITDKNINRLYIKQIKLFAD